MIDMRAFLLLCAAIILTSLGSILNGCADRETRKRLDALETRLDLRVQEGAK